VVGFFHLRPASVPEAELNRLVVTALADWLLTPDRLTTLLLEAIRHRRASVSGYAVQRSALRNNLKSIEAQIFLSHYHWDHIQGIPFFEPLYNPENYFYFHSFPGHRCTVKEALEEQMSDPYFPVNMSTMEAHRQFRELGAEGVRRLCRKNHVLYDIKHVFGAKDTDGRL